MESIRYFDAENQLSSENADSYEISPVTEFFAGRESAERIAAGLEKEAAGASLAPDYAVKVKELAGLLAARVRSGDRGLPLGFLLPLTAHCTLYEFGKFGGVVFDEVKQVYDNAAVHASEHENRFSTLFARGETLSCALGQMISTDKAFEFSGRKLAFQSVTNANRIFTPDAVFSFKTMEMPAYYKDFRILAGGCGWPVRPSDRRTKIRVGFQNRPVFFIAF